MKKFLLAGAVILASSHVAMAGDMPPPAYDWTGFYMGLNAGAGWSNSSVDIGQGANQYNLDASGTAFTGGAEAGYNWQMESLVLGLETDFNYLGLQADRNIAGPPAASLSIEENWFGTFRGRLGFAADNMLFYGTGGLAYGNAKVQGCIAGTCNSDSNVNWGWTVGAGMEYAIDQSWTLGAEYLYVDLGKPDFNVTCALCNGSADAAFSVVRATVKYKF